jgi:hypothetical protein
MLDPDVELMNMLKQLRESTPAVPKEKPFQVEVLTWPSGANSSDVFVGHSALRVPQFGNFPSQYISHWPAQSAGKGDITTAVNHSFDEDFFAEGEREPYVTKLPIKSPEELHQYLQDETPPMHYALDNSEHLNCVDRVKGVLESGAGLEFDSSYSLGDGPIDRAVQQVMDKTTPNAFKHQVQSEVRTQIFSQFKSQFQEGVRSLFGGSSMICHRRLIQHLIQMSHLNLGKQNWCRDLLVLVF